MESPNSSGSPAWSASSKRTIIIILFIGALLLLYRVRLLLLPLSLAIILAYLIEPVVKLITRRASIPRTVAILIIYLILLIALISLPVTAVTPIITQGSLFISNIPTYLEQLGVFFSEPIVLIEGYEIPIDQLPLDQVFTSLSANLVDIVQTLGGQTLSIFGSVATATLSTVGWIILILIVSFYMVKDHNRFFDAVLDMVPATYHSDVRHLSGQISLTWNAFLRGQLVLVLVVGLAVFILMTALGVPNARTLAIIAGFMELIPTFGPIFAAIPAVLIAIFQSDASWLGSLMTPLWFGLLILGVYALVYQVENYYLVPRIIGYHLKLHPLVVLLGVVAGASIAGIIGILLAAPLMATVRLILRYIYCKLVDTPPFPEEHPVLQPADPAVRPNDGEPEEEEAAQEKQIEPEDSQGNQSVGLEKP